MAPNPPPRPSQVFHFNCQFTHHLTQKKKTWHDALLDYHTFNRFVRVLDARGQIFKKDHWRGVGDVHEGIEIRVDNVLVSVQELIEREEVDLTDVVRARPGDRNKNNNGTTACAGPSVGPSVSGYPPPGAVATQTNKSLKDVLGKQSTPSLEAAVVQRARHQNRADGERGPKRQRIANGLLPFACPRPTHKEPRENTGLKDSDHPPRLYLQHKQPETRTGPLHSHQFPPPRFERKSPNWDKFRTSPVNPEDISGKPSHRQLAQKEPLDGSIDVVDLTHRLPTPRLQHVQAPSPWDKRRSPSPIDLESSNQFTRFPPQLSVQSASARIGRTSTNITKTTASTHQAARPSTPRAAPNEPHNENRDIVDLESPDECAVSPQLLAQRAQNKRHTVNPRQVGSDKTAGFSRPELARRTLRDESLNENIDLEGDKPNDFLRPSVPTQKKKPIPKQHGSMCNAFHPPRPLSEQSRNPLRIATEKARPKLLYQEKSAKPRRAADKPPPNQSRLAFSRPLPSHTASRSPPHTPCPPPQLLIHRTPSPPPPSSPKSSHPDINFGFTSAASLAMMPSAATQMALEECVRSTPPDANITDFFRSSSRVKVQERCPNAGKDRDEPLYVNEGATDARSAVPRRLQQTMQTLLVPFKYNVPELDDDVDGPREQGPWTEEATWLFDWWPPDLEKKENPELAAYGFQYAPFD